MDKIRLTNITGICRFSGTCQDDCTWTQFEVNSQAEQEPGECCICGKTTESGWLCMDGGDEACEDCVEWTPPK